MDLFLLMFWDEWQALSQTYFGGQLSGRHFINQVSKAVQLR